METELILNRNKIECQAILSNIFLTRENCFIGCNVRNWKMWRSNFFALVVNAEGKELKIMGFFGVVLNLSVKNRKWKVKKMNVRGHPIIMLAYRCNRTQDRNKKNIYLNSLRFKKNWEKKTKISKTIRWSFRSFDFFFSKHSKGIWTEKEGRIMNYNEIRL